MISGLSLSTALVKYGVNLQIICFDAMSEITLCLLL